MLGLSAVIKLQKTFKQVLESWNIKKIIQLIYLKKTIMWAKLARFFKDKIQLLE